MFTSDEIRNVISAPQFRLDYDSVRQTLVSNRVNQTLLFTVGAPARLCHFVESVLASAPGWDANDRKSICRLAGEIAESLSASEKDDRVAKRFRFDSAVLYDLADLPALSSAVIEDQDVNKVVAEFFQRDGVFGSLEVASITPDCATAVDNVKPGFHLSHLAELAFRQDAIEYSKYQRDEEQGSEFEGESKVAADLAREWSLGMNASELEAYSAAIENRKQLATVSNVSFEMFQMLCQAGFPAELLPAQRQAIQTGLLDWTYDSWGFAAPTGSGKTFISRILIMNLLQRRPEAKCLYVVPSRALVTEVSASLEKGLEPLSANVTAVSAQLTDLEDEEEISLNDSSVVVLTPEKADLILRLDADFLQQVSLVVIDEAHHIESGTRGALLELYLWRLRRVLKASARFVFLSAVAPNISDIANWLGKHPGSTVVSHRPTRMRAGVYRLKGKGVKSKGVIEYVDGTRLEVVSERAEKTNRKGIVQLASFLKQAGPVLVVAKGKKECENIAAAAQLWQLEKKSIGKLSRGELNSDEYRSLDSHLERELYSNVPMRELLKNRIAYHHAGLPPQVRRGVEDMIRAGMIDYVFATTTLAEGVNFPFSSVVVQALALREAPEKGRPARYSPVTPRSFWNIAGRAGRPGFDGEGQVILFEPSLGLDKIEAVIEDYLDPDMSALGPVKSALASAIEEIKSAIAADDYGLDSLNQVSIPESVSKKVRGAVNLLRVGIIHAKAARIADSPEEIIESSFARMFLDNKQTDFAKQFVRSQAVVLDKYLAEDDSPPIEAVSKLGLSLETLGELRTYIRQMKDWQIKRFSQLFYGGKLNLKDAVYVVGPVASRMAELEGKRLGGFYSEVIISWLSGVPFSRIKSDTKFKERLEDLVSVIYSRIQYMLPWGLYAFDEIVELEAERRGINYENEVRKLAFLADAGVPSFSAYQLVNLDIERVDATRLGNAYDSEGGLEQGIDVLTWLVTRPYEEVESIVKGPEDRRVAHKFLEKLLALRSLKI